MSYILKTAILSILLLSVVSASNDTALIDFESTTLVELNPKPESLAHLKILPPSQQKNMVTLAKPMTTHSNRGTAKGGENISLKGKRRSNSAAAAYNKTKTERDNGLRDF